MDSQPPTSSVASLPPFTITDSFNVSWSGTDAGISGLKNYDIYVSIDGGPYTLWQDATSATSAAFTVVEGSQFRFYSRARDNAGNLEAAPATPDAQTTVDAVPPFVASTQYDFEHNQLIVGFSEDVLASLQQDPRTHSLHRDVIAAEALALTSLLLSLLLVELRRREQI